MVFTKTESIDNNNVLERLFSYLTCLGSVSSYDTRLESPPFNQLFEGVASNMRSGYVPRACTLET